MCVLTSYSGDQIQEAADGSYGTFVEEQNCIQFLLGNLKEREYFLNIDADGRT